MKLIIDINDNEYMGIKGYPNNVTSYPVTIHIYDAIRNGVPLDDVEAEIEKRTIKERATGFDFIMIDVLRHILADIGKETE